MHIEVFCGNQGQWYWHLKARNGKIIADNEAFASKGNAIRAAKGVVKAVFRPVSGSMKVTFNQKMNEKDGGYIITWSAY